MTTNQTIDGVPSECKECGGTSLTWFAQSENKSGVQEGRLRTHEVSSVFVLGCDDCSETLRVVSADKIAALLNKPAAQPQGEPVAWMDPRSPEMHATISNEVKQHNLKFCGAPSAAVNGYSIPLYAEQPAPVAVVLPERREPTQDNPYLSDADHEWNAYRDELKRLNPSL